MNHENIRQLKSVVKLRYLTIDLDCTFRACQGFEELFVILKTLDGMSQKPRQPAGIFGFSLGQVFNAHFEILAVSVDGANHDLVPQHKSKVQLVGRNFNATVASCNA